MSNCRKFKEALSKEKFEEYFLKCMYNEFIKYQKDASKLAYGERELLSMMEQEVT